MFQNSLPKWLTLPNKSQIMLIENVGLEPLCIVPINPRFTKKPDESCYLNYKEVEFRLTAKNVTIHLGKIGPASALGYFKDLTLNQFDLLIENQFDEYMNHLTKKYDFNNPRDSFISFIASKKLNIKPYTFIIKKHEIILR